MKENKSPQFIKVVKMNEDTSTYWYNKFVGEKFEMIEDCGRDWKVKHDDDGVYFIDKEDGELVTQFTPSKDAEEAFKKVIIQFVQYYVNLKPHEMCTVHPPGGDGMIGLYDLPIEQILDKWIKKYNAFKFIAGRSSQPIERVDAKDGKLLTYEEFIKTYMPFDEVHRAGDDRNQGEIAYGCYEKYFAEFTSTHPTNKMRESLQMVKDYFFEVGHEEDYADEVYENVVAALSTKPTDEHK